MLNISHLIKTYEQVLNELGPVTENQYVIDMSECYFEESDMKLSDVYHDELLLLRRKLAAKEQFFEEFITPLLYAITNKAKIDLVSNPISTQEARDKILQWVENA